MKFFLPITLFLMLLSSCEPDLLHRYLPQGLSVRQAATLIEGNVVPFSTAALARKGSLTVVFRDYVAGQLGGQQDWKIAWDEGEFDAACLVIGPSDDGPAHIRATFHGFLPMKSSDSDALSARKEARSFPLDFAVRSSTMMSMPDLGDEHPGTDGQVLVTYASNGFEPGESPSLVSQDAETYLGSETFRKLDRVVVVTVQPGR